jgi:tetratricopeptide (TPR) repeat protein
MKALFGILLIVLISSCSSVKVKRNYEEVIVQASQLMEEGDLKAAEQMLLKSVEGVESRPSPFVEDGIAYFYTNDQSQTLMVMMSSAMFHLDRESGKIDSLDNLGELNYFDKKLNDLYQETPFGSTAAIKGDIPEIYLLLGINYINMKDNKKAKEYIEKSLELFPENGSAWSEKIYMEMMTGDIVRAKRSIDEALAIPYIDKYGKAAILRKKGWIEIEEGKLDEAKKTFEDSIELDDHPTAHAELEYIDQLQKRK